MPNEQTYDIHNKAKSIKLLHLDHLQREALSQIITKFLNGNPIGINEIVESFATYILDMVRSSLTSEEYICDNQGIFDNEVENSFKEFSDAIFLCAKYRLHYQKIFSSEDIKNSLIKALYAQDQLTSHHLNELEYTIKIATYKMLESDNTKVIDYLDNIKHFYFRSLATVNPSIAKRAFIDQIINLLTRPDNHTISDISNIINIYAKYLGKQPINHDKIEELVHKYSGTFHELEKGTIHAAKIEVFKILEGL